MVVEQSGDILRSGADMICQQVNCRGVMGAGLAKQIREKYPDVYRQFREKSLQIKRGQKALGDVLYCQEVDCIIANLYGQDDFGRDGRQYTNYDALKRCLENVRDKVRELSQGMEEFRVALPHGLGCGLAGGDWTIVRGMIEAVFGDPKCLCEIWKK